MTNQFIMAIDQGTTSTRAIVFDHAGRIVATGQKEHAQIMPQAGWVEHDPIEIWANVREVMAQSLAKANLTKQNIAAIGITNQRETTVVWDKTTGRPVYNAIVWQDTRTASIIDQLGIDDGQDVYQQRTGLPLATYFCGPKVKWILDNVPGAREDAAAGRLVMGTMDTWLAWHLTGGLHVTDVTNASRTMLMDLRTQQWAPDICDDMTIPETMLPEIRSCSQVYGAAAANSLLAGVPIAGLLGDQHAALFGQACFAPGTAKNTYGTGCFLLMNTGDEPVLSRHGLLTTIGFKIGDAPASFALEGSVAVAGSLVQWLRDNLGIIEGASQIEELAASVTDNGGAYFVPAFSGLFAPYWRPDARGAIVGLTRYVNKAHLARAVLEATAYQTREVVEAMEADSGVALSQLKVDGGMTANSLLMQFQADQLGVPVVRPVVAETTALGAAYAAGLAVGYWQSEADIVANWAEDARWTPAMGQALRDELYAQWQKAVTKTFDWVS